MAREIAKSFTSDAPLSHVSCKLDKTANGQFWADSEIAFNGGKRVVTKRVNLSVLTQAERDAGLLFYNAVHRETLALVTEDEL